MNAHDAVRAPAARSGRCGGLLLGAAVAREREGDHVGGDERPGLHEPTTFLGDDHRVADRGTGHRAAAVLLGHEEREPAELSGFTEERRVVRDGRVGELTHPRDRAPRVDEPRRGLAEQLLVVGQLEVHCAPPR